MQEDIIAIPLKVYNMLVLRDFKLSCLENAGVDNWEGYDYAMEEYRAGLEEE